MTPEQIAPWLATSLLTIWLTYREVRRRLTSTASDPGTTLNTGEGVRDLVAQVQRLEAEALTLRTRVTELETWLTVRDDRAAVMERRIDQLLTALDERDRIIDRLRPGGIVASDDAGHD